MKNQKIVAGNWKMNKTLDEGISFVGKMSKLLLDIERTKVIFCPPFTALVGMMEQLRGTTHGLGAQNCYWKESGAFTGEVSCSMLSELGVQYIIIGHSERRHVFRENDELINQKIHSVIAHNLTPIFCVGETEEQRKFEETQEVLEDQIDKGLREISNIGDIIIAYEPVWAIGTGLNANETQIEEAHTLVRQKIQNNYSVHDSENMPILYGGSVNPKNANSLISTPGVDGFLVGGASLARDSFYQIINTVEQFSKE